MVVSFLVVNGLACAGPDGWFLAAPAGLSFDDDLVGGGGEPVGRLSRLAEIPARCGWMLHAA